jgi:hypothetical protein
VSGSLFVTPNGFLACDGSIYNRSAYPALASYIGSPAVAGTATVTTSGGSADYYATCNSAGGYLLSSNISSNITYGAANVANALRYSSDGINWTGLAGVRVNVGYSIAPVNFPYFAAIGGVYAYMPYQTNGSVGVVYGSSMAGMTNKGQISATYPYYVQGGYWCLVAGGTSSVFVATGWSYVCCGGGTASANAYSSTSCATGTWSAITLPGVSVGLYIQGAASPSAVILYQPGKVWYSASGVGTYTDISSNFTYSGSNYINSISYANNQFIATSTSGSVYVSQTGASGTWNLLTLTSAGTQDGSLISWNGSIYASRNYYSSDLKRWTTSPALAQAALGTLFYQTYATGTAGTVLAWGAPSYSSTQFPVPALSPPTPTNYSGSGVTPVGYFIKT